MGLADSLKQKIKEQKVAARQRSAANKQIKQKARTARLQERESQAVRFAREREKLKTQEKLKRMKQPKQQFSVAGRTGGSNPGVLDFVGSGASNQKSFSVFGEPPKQQTQQPKKKKKTYPKKQPKKKRKKSRPRQPQKPRQPEKFDVVGM